MMRDDLGTWPPEQAAVLVQILRDHGIDAAADRVSGGTRVTVAAEDSSRATAVMSTTMDQIAAAASHTPTGAPPRDHEDMTTMVTHRPHRRPDDEPGPPLVMERFRRMAPVLGVLVAALMVALMVPGWFRIVAMVIALVTIAVLWVRDPDDDRDP